MSDREQSIAKIINNFSKIKIAVIGDFMLDEYLIGSVERISPEAPVPIVKIVEEQFALGGAANVINNLISLGATVIPFGVIGKDDNGKKLLNALDGKIKNSNIFYSDDRPTIVKKRVISGSQQLIRLDWEDNSKISTELEQKIIESFSNQIENLDAVILSDYDKGTLTSNLSKEIIKICKDNNILVTVDPKPKNIANYANASSITPNKREAILCLNSNENLSIEEIGLKIKEKFKFETVLMTRSEEGMTLFKEKILNIPTFAKEVYDVTGAGDTVISVFTLAKAAGASWFEAAKIANTAAGVVVGKRGTSTISSDEILKYYNEIYEV